MKTEGKIMVIERTEHLIFRLLWEIFAFQDFQLFSIKNFTGFAYSVLAITAGDTNQLMLLLPAESFNFFFDYQKSLWKVKGQFGDFFLYVCAEVVT